MYMYNCIYSQSVSCRRLLSLFILSNCLNVFVWHNSSIRKNKYESITKITIQFGESLQSKLSSSELLLLHTSIVHVFWCPRQTQHQNQDQDSLLVKRRNDNHSRGPAIRELVPSSHQRSEFSNTIHCIFSRWDQGIGEGIPIPDSLGEEATFINICISNGSLKCHRVLISKTPSFGDKVICWYMYTSFTFKTFI